MNAAQVAYMGVSIGYPEDQIHEAVALADPTLDRDSILELVSMARTEWATNLAEQDEAIEVERQAARKSEWEVTTKEDDDSEGDRGDVPRASGV